MNTFLIYFIFLSCFLCSPHSYGQLTVATSTFKVEPLKFSLPIQDLANSFLDKPAPAFQANDLNQVSRTISNYYGKSFILFFWSKEDQLAAEYIPYCNDLIKELATLRADLLSFGDESRSQIQQYVNEHDIQYTVVPNGAFLGEAIYGKELGTPRFFIADKKGIIRYVVPAKAAIDPLQTIGNLKAFLSGLMAND